TGNSSALTPLSNSKRTREAVLPLWSRLLEHNGDGRLRKKVCVHKNRYQVEISNLLWSLWGTAKIVNTVREPSQLSAGYFGAPGRMLACCVIACCAASFHSLDSWNSDLLDHILVNGQEYYDASLVVRQRRDWTGDLSLETLHSSCALDGQEFWVDTEKVVSGKLYSKTKSLGYALSVFFRQHLQTGILQLKDQALAFGFIPEYSAGGAFFMFHCQASGKPLFEDSITAPYVLRMRQLQQLLYCILITLDERRHNVPFRIHKVTCIPKTT
ncbi:hypothetical protein KR009_002749, partial [Drosophila setifemur]